MNLTRLLVLVNVLAFIWQMATNGLDTNRGLYDHGALFPPAVLDGQWWRIVTGAFLHGSISHIALNMLALWQVGSFCEMLFGRTRFALVYTLATIGSGLAVVQFSPLAVTVGASGAIFGLFGALVAAGVRLGPRGRSLIQQTLPVVAINVLFTFAIPNISIAGHFGGLLSGFVAGFVLYRTRRAEAVAVGRVPEEVVPVHAVVHAADYEEVVEGELLDPEPRR